jgi:nucleotide-binding universal stress UspA family protein
MKKILVPTDFSRIAANAFAYAQRLAAQQGAEVEVMHAYHPSFDYSNPYLDVPATEFDSIKRDLLDNFVEEFTAGEGSVVALPKTKLHIGFASEEIVRQSKEVDLIVMGTTGEGNLLEQTFGSVSTYVAQYAHCPVLFVPGNCEVKPFEDIVFASNNQAADEALITQVMDMMQGRSANIHFVHIDNSTNTPYHVEEVLYEEAARRNMPGIGFNTVEIECPNVQEGIVRYAEDIKADLIVMGTAHRGFLERLFHKSVTREVVFHTAVPLLVMHYDD